MKSQRCRHIVQFLNVIYDTMLLALPHGRRLLLPEGRAAYGSMERTATVWFVNRRDSCPDVSGKKEVAAHSPKFAAIT